MFELACLLLLLQDLLLEVEQKTKDLTELSLQSEGLLMEGGVREALVGRVRMLKGGLLELQRILQERQADIQVRHTHSLTSR